MFAWMVCLCVCVCVTALDRGLSAVDTAAEKENKKQNPATTSGRLIRFQSQNKTRRCQTAVWGRPRRQSDSCNTRKIKPCWPGGPSSALGRAESINVKVTETLRKTTKENVKKAKVSFFFYLWSKTSKTHNHLSGHLLRFHLHPQSGKNTN